MGKIVLKDVTVEYDMPSVKYNTLKEHVLARMSGKLSHQAKKAVSNVNLEINPGGCVGLIGENGCGKSTTLKVIAGILTPKSGSIETQGHIAPLIELGAGFDPELTGIENVYLACSLMGLTRQEIDAKIDEIEEFAELGEFFRAPVKTYSSGMYMRLGFSCTTVVDAEIILIDEILAVGDINYQRKCMNALARKRESGATLVIVSHDLGTIQSMTNRVVYLDQGKIICDGTPRECIEKYQADMARKELEKIPKSVRDEEKRKKELLENAAQEVRGESLEILQALMQKPSGDIDLSSGQPWEIKLLLKVKKTLPNEPVIGFAVHTADGDQRLFGGNNIKFRGNVTSPQSLVAPGEYEVRFSFDNLPLATGQYKLIVAAHNSGLTETLDISNPAQMVEVVNETDRDNFDRDLLGASTFLKEIKMGLRQEASGN